MVTRQLTRRERSERNRERHARRRAVLEAGWREQAHARREEREERRRANREAWHRKRYGSITPGTESLADDMPGLKCASFERPELDEWQIIGEDGRGYWVIRDYHVQAPGLPDMVLPSIQDVTDLVNMCVSTCLDTPQFQAGTSCQGYEIVKVARKSITLRDKHGRTFSTKIRYTDEGDAWVRSDPRSAKWSRDLYARDFA